MLKRQIKSDAIAKNESMLFSGFSVLQSNLFSIFILDILGTQDSDPDGNTRIHWLPSLLTHQKVPCTGTGTENASSTTAEECYIRSFMKLCS